MERHNANPAVVRLTARRKPLRYPPHRALIRATWRQVTTADIDQGYKGPSDRIGHFYAPARLSKQQFHRVARCGQPLLDCQTPRESQARKPNETPVSRGHDFTGSAPAGPGTLSRPSRMGSKNALPRLSPPFALFFILFMSGLAAAAHAAALASQLCSVTRPRCRRRHGHGSLASNPPPSASRLAPFHRCFFSNF